MKVKIQLTNDDQLSTFYDVTFRIVVSSNTTETSSNETASADDTQESSTGSIGNFSTKTFRPITTKDSTRKAVDPNQFKPTVVVKKPIVEDEEPYVAPRPPIISMQ